MGWKWGCVVCGGTPSLPDGLCQTCWPIYKDRRHEEWLKQLRNDNARLRRADKRDRTRLVSLEQFMEWQTKAFTRGR